MVGGGGFKRNKNNITNSTAVTILLSSSIPNCFTFKGYLFKHNCQTGQGKDTKEHSLKGNINDNKGFTL